MSRSYPSATAPAEQQTAPAIDEAAEVRHDDADLLIEDVSIDGMCGVY
ncbi:mycofactocin precursor MftA [Dactylosporangium sp. NPDC000555]